MKKVAVTAKVKFRAYDATHRAVEEGVARGLRKANKHTENPNEEQLSS